MSQYDKEPNGMWKINMLLEKAVSLIPKEESLTEEASRVEPVRSKDWWEEGFSTEDSLLFMEHLVIDKQFNAKQMLEVLNKPWRYDAMYKSWDREGRKCHI